MRKSECVVFLEKYLWEVSGGHGYRERENPAVQFSNDARKGRYNEISDEKYNFLLNEVKEFSAFWLDKEKQTSADVLRIFLENIDIDKESLHKMGEILAGCYLSRKHKHQ